MVQLPVAVGAFAVTWLLTAAFQNYAIKKGILDIPNHRSSHTTPTPRGAGLGFAVVFLVLAALVGLFSPSARSTSLALIGGGAIVAAVGWLDDRMGLSARTRLLVHMGAAVVGVVSLGGLPEVSLGFTQVRLGLFGTVLAIMWVAWSINAYNFMDGIDGLAAGQAVLVSIVGGMLLLSSGASELGTLALGLAGAVGGFLVWNFPPAKVFMGDVGSGVLGYTFAVLAIAAERHGGMPLLSWVLLLLVFYVDTGATLLRRMIRRERWMEAHRSHAYQLAVQLGYSHRTVTLTILLLGLGLSMLTYGLQLWPRLLLPMLATASAGVFTVWCRFVMMGQRLLQEGSRCTSAHSHSWSRDRRDRDRMAAGDE